jgi:hypothetical protein
MDQQPCDPAFSHLTRAVDRAPLLDCRATAARISDKNTFPSAARKQMLIYAGHEAVQSYRQAKMKPPRPYHFVLFCSAALAAGAIYNADWRYDLRPGFQIKASPYRWNLECPLSGYYEYHYVKRGCARAEYAINDTADEGLSNNYNGHQWYRIGNDAVFLGCDIFGNDCLYETSVHNRFRQ